VWLIFMSGLPIAPRPEAKQYRQTQSQKKAAHQHGLRCVASYDRLRNAFRPAAVTTTSAPRASTVVAQQMLVNSASHWPLDDALGLGVVPQQLCIRRLTVAHTLLCKCICDIL
jgi:hypothetical protein